MAGHGQDLRQKPRYQLDPDEFESLTLQLVRRFRSQFQKAAEDGHSSICIALEGTDPLSDICRDIERRAFATLADNLPAHTMAEEYGPYEQQSLFLLGLDTAEGLPRATLRLIIGIAGIGPPTKSVRDAVLHDGYREELERPIDLRDTEDQSGGTWQLTCGEVGSVGLAQPSLSRRAVESSHQIQPGALIFDVGTLARLPEVNARAAGTLWTPLLVAGAMRLADRIGVHHAVTFVTADLVRVLRRLCGAPWQVLGGLGEVVYVPGDSFTSQPCYLRVADLHSGVRSPGKSGSARPVPQARLDRFAHDSDTDTAFVLWQ